MKNQAVVVVVVAVAVVAAVAALFWRDYFLWSLFRMKHGTLMDLSH